MAVSADPQPYIIFFQAAALLTESLHNTHHFGETLQPPETKTNFLWKDFAEMKLLQLAEVVSQIAHHFTSTRIPLQPSLWR